MINIRIKNFLLFLIDTAIFFFSLYLTLYFRYFLFGQEKLEKVTIHFFNHLPHFIVIFLIFFLIFHINHLYNLRLITNFKKLIRLSLSSLGVSILFSTLYFYLNVSATIAPRTNLFIFLLIYTILFLLWRYFFFLKIHRKIGKRLVIIIGNNDLSDKLVKEINKNPNLGYRLHFIIKNKEELYKLEEIIKEKGNFQIVFSGNLNDDIEVRNLLFKYLPEKINFFSYPEFYELLTEKIPVEAINQEWFLSNLKEASKNYYNFSKRLLDIFLSLSFFLISLIFWPLIALLIKLDSKGPVFFKQKRLGMKGKVFYIKKFRSMTTIDNNFSPTEKEDKRITKIGKWLRVTRIDELPQLINILKGEMSFIGPRPERPEIVAKLENSIAFYRTRLLVKPGLTGWDQVSGEYHSPSIEDSLEKLQYDLYYIKNRSLYLDFNIILKTISIVLGRKGR